MVGGVAVQGNLLCVTWSAARGHVFLFDLEAQQRVSAWTMPVGPQGYSDAAGVAMDEHYHLFVADPHNDRVCHFSAFGRLLQSFGQPAPIQGDAGRDRPGVLDRPHAVALRGDLLYVACGDAPRRRGVQRFSRTGTLLKPLASRGDPDARFGAPRGLWADADGVLVADTLRGVVQRFCGDGAFVGEVPCADAGALARPIAVARLSGGALLLADRGDAAGVRVLGIDGRARSGADALIEHCRDPIGFALDRRGQVYVLDRLGERVLQFSAELAFVRVVIDLAELFDDAPSSAPNGS
jgi:hypothetical protein